MAEQIYSVVLYVFVFSCTILCFWMGEQLGPRGEKGAICRKALFFVGVLLPCLLAGLRADSVGIDVNVYIVPNIKTARAVRGGFFEVCKALDGAPEYLYMLLVYMTTRITDDAGLLLFLIQLLTFLPIVIAAIQLKKEISIPLAVTTYLLCIYHTTLNFMRQGMSCAFILLGTAYLFRNNMKINRRSALSYLCASMLHKTGLFGAIAIYILCKLSTTKTRRKLYYLAYAAIILIPIIIEPLFIYLLSLGVLSESYVYYGNIFLYGAANPQWFFSNRFSLYPTALALLLIWRTGIPCFYTYINGTRGNPRLSSARAISICGLIMYLIVQYTFSTNYGNRLTFPFEFFLILLVPYAAQGRRRIQKIVVLVLAMFVFWICYMIILKMGGGAHIYKFRI